MSGSYDRPTGPPTLASEASAPGARFPYRSRHGSAHAREPTPHAPASSIRRQPKATTRARPRRPDHAQANAPIVPAGSVTGRSLTLVITIMCFLACLTAGAVYMMNQSASAWLRDIASEVTVQIEARDRADIDKVVADVASFLPHSPALPPSGR